MATTNAQILALLERVDARLSALESTPAPVVGAPASTVITFATKENGGGFPCKATDGVACTRVLRTEKRALTHGVEAGHEARA